VSDDWPFEHTEKRMAIAAVAAKTEPELLVAIEQQEDGARIVYADWLEEQGDSERAEYVRLQDAIHTLPDGEEREHALHRVSLLSGKLDAAWRVVVARPRIRNCPREDCPREWGALAPTHTSDLRVCRTCDTRLEFRFHAANAVGPTVSDNVYDEAPEWANTMEWARRRR
jgi:uncharacterized protein (TIGR02996 family)